MRCLAVHDEINEGLIFTLSDRGIDELEDLRGKKVALGDELSTLGSVVPKAKLHRAGLRNSDLAPGSAHLGSHDTTVESVLSGDFDAGAAHAGVVDTVVRVRKPLSRVTILERTVSPSRTWVAASGVDAKTAEVFKGVLLGMDHKVVEQYQKGLRGFMERSDEYFAPLEDDIEAADAFGTVSSKP